LASKISPVNIRRIVGNNSIHHSLPKPHLICGQTGEHSGKKHLLGKAINRCQNLAILDRPADKTKTVRFNPMTIAPEKDLLSNDNRCELLQKSPNQIERAAVQSNRLNPSDARAEFRARGSRRIDWAMKATLGTWICAINSIVFDFFQKATFWTRPTILKKLIR
jgi:hypothetical protein